MMPWRRSKRMNLAPRCRQASRRLCAGSGSQWVGELVEAHPGERVLDMCAAPGGKATALAATGAEVIAADVHPGRARLVFQNARATRNRRRGARRRRHAPAVRGPRVRSCARRRALLGPRSAAAPCRCPLANRADDVIELAALQQRLLDEAARVTGLAAPRLQRLHPDRGGVDQPPISRRLDAACRAFDAVAAIRRRWTSAAHETNTDGMTILRYRRPHERSRHTLSAKVLTVSDGVVHGTREDKSGAALVEQLTEAGFDVVDHQVTADGIDNVAAAADRLCEGFAGLVVSTGGTGFAPRDQTPEGTRLVIEREAPGLAEAMRLISPLGRLSRGIAGIRGHGHHLQHARLAEGLRRAARRDPRRAASRPATSPRDTDATTESDRARS